MHKGRHFRIVPLRRAFFQVVTATPAMSEGIKTTRV